MKRVVYHRLAASEFIKASVFYETRRPLLGGQFMDEIDATRDKILKNPARGRPEKFGLRSLKLRRFPYRLFYQVEPSALDCRRGALEPQPGLLDATPEMTVAPSHRTSRMPRARGWYFGNSASVTATAAARQCSLHWLCSTKAAW